MQLARKRIISASLIAAAFRNAASPGSDRLVNPARPIVRRSVPLPFTSNASPSLIDVFPPPGWTSRGSRPIRVER